MNAKIKKFLAFVCRIYWHDTPSKIIAIGTLINCSAMFDHSLAGCCRTWVGSAMIVTCCGFIIIQSRRRMAKFRAADQAHAVNELAALYKPEGKK